MEQWPALRCVWRDQNIVLVYDLNNYYMLCTLPWKTVTLFDLFAYTVLLLWLLSFCCHELLFISYPEENSSIHFIEPYGIWWGRPKIFCDFTSSITECLNDAGCSHNNMFCVNRWTIKVVYKAFPFLGEWMNYQKYNANSNPSIFN